MTELDFSGNSDVAGELHAGFLSLSALTYLDISGTKLCVPDNRAFEQWLGREEISFAGNDGYVCEEGEGTGEEGESAGEDTPGGGGGGCAVASEAQRGVFHLVLLVFALGAACAWRFGVFRRGQEPPGSSPGELS